MNPLADIILKFETQVKAEEAQLKAKLIALELLKKEAGQISVIQNQNEPTSIAPEITSQSEQGTKIAEYRTGSVVSIVKNQVEKIGMGGHEFSVNEICQTLKNNGVIESEQTWKPRVSTVLTKLTKDGAIEITSKGGGSVPNRYKLVDHL